MGDYGSQRKWSDQYLEKIKIIVGPYMLETADFVMDTTMATDLVLVNHGKLNLACRVRTPGYYEKYPFDVTVRARVKNGGPTEMHKLIAGCGDWAFYGHVNKQDEIFAWWLYDLDIWRHEMKTNTVVIRQSKNLMPNGDGTWLCAFDLRKFDNENIVIAGSNCLPPKPPKQFELEINEYERASRGY